MTMYLLALRNSCSESFDAGRIEYPLFIVPVPGFLNKTVVAQVQTCQRPDGGNVISRKVGSGLYSHLLALGEEGSEHDGARNAKLLATEVSFKH